MLKLGGHYERLFYNQNKSEAFSLKASQLLCSISNNETDDDYQVFPVFSFGSTAVLKGPFPIDHEFTMHADVSAVGRWCDEVIVAPSSALTSGPYVF